MTILFEWQDLNFATGVRILLTLICEAISSPIIKAIGAIRSNDIVDMASAVNDFGENPIVMQELCRFD